MALIHKVETGSKITYTVLLDDGVTPSHTVELTKTDIECRLAFRVPWGLTSDYADSWVDYAEEIEAGNTII